MASRSFNLSSRLLGEAVWTRMFEDAAHLLETCRHELVRRTNELESLRSLAQYNTGSIGVSAQLALFVLAHHWRPAKVLEVGTFIGKSTLSIALGAAAAGARCEIHTCDASNRFDLPAFAEAKVVQYQGTGSTQMLSDVLADDGQGAFQLVHVDGRLQAGDYELLSRLLSQDAIFALDDFEGGEKGVANLMNIRASGLFAKHLLLYPPNDAVRARYKLVDVCTTALMVPIDCLHLTAQ